MKNKAQDNELTTITIRLENSVRDELVRLAAEDKRPLSNYVRLALGRHIQSVRTPQTETSNQQAAA
jgi:hypothetical protein